MPTHDMGPLPESIGESIAEVICRLIDADPHQWSERPCQTCTAVSALVTRPCPLMQEVL